MYKRSHSICMMSTTQHLMGKFGGIFAVAQMKENSFQFVLIFRFYFLTCRDDDCAYNGELDNVPLWSDASPIEETKDFNQLLDSPEFYFHPMANSSPINDVMDDTNFEHASSSEDGVSVKKYEFNPTVEPFHPMKKTFSDASSDTNISCSSPECIPTDISIDSSNTVETTETTSSEKSRTLPKKFVCILCPEKFSTLDELNQHIQNKVQQPCICIICGMSYAYHYQLQRHFSGHRSSKIFSCRCCHKKFRSLNQIRKHFDFCRFKLYLYI